MENSLRNGVEKLLKTYKSDFRQLPRGSVELGCGTGEPAGKRLGTIMGISVYASASLAAGKVVYKDSSGATLASN